MKKQINDLKEIRNKICSHADADVTRSELWVTIQELEEINKIENGESSHIIMLFIPALAGFIFALLLVVIGSLLGG
jgi:hypothetical protein